MMNAYILRGVTDEYCLVFRSDEAEDVCRIIARLRKCRDKDLQRIADQLEKDFNERYRSDPSNARPKNKG